MVNEAWSSRRRLSPWLKTTSSKDAFGQVRRRLAAARLDLGRGRSDRVDQRPVGALAHHQLLVGALHLRQVVHHPGQQEHHHQHGGELHLQREQAEEEADADHDRQQGLLQRRQRLLADHLATDRPLELAGLVGDERIDMVFARHRLQRLGGRERGADGRDQGAQERGLVLAGTARDADQPLQQDQEQRPRHQRRHARVPGDRQGDAEIDQRVEQHRRHLGAMLERLGRALRLGGDGVRESADRLLQVVAPARRHDRPDQRQAQVGGDVGDGVADLPIGEQRQNRLQADQHDRQGQQHRRRRRQADELGRAGGHLLRQRRLMIRLARRQAEHRQQHRHAEAVHQPGDEHGEDRRRAPAGIGADVGGEHRQRASALHRGEDAGRIRAHGQLRKRRRGPGVMTTGRAGSVSKRSPSST